LINTIIHAANVLRFEARVLAAKMTADAVFLDFAATHQDRGVLGLDASRAA
jgi:hypothetical protein